MHLMLSSILALATPSSCSPSSSASSSSSSSSSNSTTKTPKVVVDIKTVGFTCNICGKEFNDRSNWRKHCDPDKGHHQIHTCRICNKRLKTKEILQMHVRQHLNTSKYRCGYCDKRCVSSSSLHKHLMKHTGERPFACPYCNATKSDRSNLLKHIRVHTKERPYRCHICGKNYTDRSNLLLRHLPLHQDDLHRMRCPICGKGSIQKIALEKHMLRHEGWKFRRCTRCGMEARRIENGCVWCFKKRFRVNRIREKNVSQQKLNFSSFEKNHLRTLVEWMADVRSLSKNQHNSAGGSG
mmetsp:Transcript_8229/g.15954  ORF Transcript_8229/g.15954 Transcript_8229/m.15954 type:complete len:296 (+) Transcript_8229:105-992(+)